MIETDYLVIGTKEEIDRFKREIDFNYSKKPIRKNNNDNDIDNNINILFHHLSPHYKSLVSRAIYTLIEEKEYFGYNFREVRKWFFHSGVPMLKVLNVIDNNSENADKITTLSELSSKLKKLDRTINLTSDDNKELIKEICNNFMISFELLTQGEGKVYNIHLNENGKADLEEFSKLMNSDINLKRECSNTFKFFECFESFLKNKYPNHDDIIKFQYAKIKKNGAYFILKEKVKYSNSLKCIDNLIRELYAIDKVITPRL